MSRSSRFFFLRPLLSEFPNAALGALVIREATRLIEWDEFRALLKFRRTEFLLAIATTLGVVLSDILFGVVVAIVLSVTDLIARISRPHNAVLGRAPDMSGFHDVEDYRVLPRFFTTIGEAVEDFESSANPTL